MKRKLTANNIWYWITDNVKTLDATEGILPFPDYRFLRDLVEALDSNRWLIAAKSRQMLATWTVCAFVLYKALYANPGTYLMLSKGARDSEELLKRLKIIVNNLQGAERDEIRVRKERIEFSNESRIIALPATEDAVRMHSPAGVFWDEMAFTPVSDAIWTAVKPALDSGGSFWGVSTPNGSDNIFHQLYMDAANGITKHRIHWSEHPHRDENWRLNAAQGLSESKWKQEYEIDFDVLIDRVYSEYDPLKHVLSKQYQWNSEKGRTFRAIDFGYRHPYVIWAQQSVEGNMVIFDEWEGHDATIEDMALQISRIDLKHGISESDVTVTACDPAGAAINDSGLSAVERLKKKGMKLTWRNSEILTGVELVKVMLKDSNGNISLRFSPTVQKLLDHLRHYRWGNENGNPVKDDVHDHGLDALRYLIINLHIPTPKASTRPLVAGGKMKSRI